jgi:tellurite resistance protein
MTLQTPPAGSYKRLIRNMRRQAERDDKFERMRRALIEIEHHSTDKNAQATARAALALAHGEFAPQDRKEG